MSIDVNCTAWKGFRTGEWRHLVNVRNFIQKNYSPYSGDASFLAPISPKTAKVWEKAEALIVGKAPSAALFEEAGKAVSEEMIARTGIRWSTEYKKPVIEALIQRALCRAAGLPED